MSDDEMSEDTLNEIAARLERLENAVFGSQTKRSREKAVEPKYGQGLPAHILRLRDQGFFKSPQTAAEVYARLQGDYQCEPDRVGMALLRLQRRQELRKTSKVVGKKKQVAYVW